MILLKSAIAATLMAAQFAQQTTGCMTSDPKCFGTATFHNFLTSANCASVRWPSGVYNFCLPSNGSVDKYVPSQSQVCWSGNAVVPPRACDLQWIYVANPGHGGR
jgi:hypothetical protein